MNCTNLETIEIPDCTTSIDEYAFYACTSLETIIIPDSVTFMGVSVFYNCSNLKSITLSDSITTIENYLFANCSSIESIVIPNSVNSIGASAFQFCINLKTIEIPGSVNNLLLDCFNGCGNISLLYTSEESPASKEFYFENCTKKYVATDNSITISDTSSDDNSFSIIIDTDKFGGNPETAKFLSSVNVLVDDVEYDLLNCRYTDETKQFIEFVIQYTNNSQENKRVRGEVISDSTSYVSAESEIL